MTTESVVIEFECGSLTSISSGSPLTSGTHLPSDRKIWDSLKDNRTSEQRMFDSHCTFQPTLIATKNRLKVYNAASSVRKDYVKRDNCTIQNYVRQYQGGNLGTIGRDKLNGLPDYTLKSENNWTPSGDLIEGITDHYALYSLVDNFNVNLDEAASVLLAGAAENNVTVECQNVENLKAVEDNGSFFKLRSDAMTDFDEVLEEIRNYAMESKKISQDNNERKLSTGLSLDFADLIFTLEKIELAASPDKSGAYQVITEEYLKIPPIMSVQDSELTEHDDSNDVASLDNSSEEFKMVTEEVEQTIKTERITAGKKSIAKLSNLSSPASYEKCLLFMKTARNKRDEANQINKSLEMRHYDPVCEKKRRATDGLDYWVERDFHFPTDIRKSTKGKTFRNISSKSPEKIDPIKRCNPAASLVRTSTPWVNSYRAGGSTISSVPRVRSFASTYVKASPCNLSISPPDTSVTPIRSKLSISTPNSSDSIPSATSEAGTPSKNEINNHLNILSHITPNAKSSPIPANSSFHVHHDCLEDPYSPDASYIIESVSKMYFQKDTNIHPIYIPEILTEKLSGLREEKSRSITKKASNTQCAMKLSTPAQKKQSESGLAEARRSGGICKIHQKLVDKYQDILGIDLAVFDGTLGSFKTLIPLKP